MNNEQIKHMVDRFLGWRLPDSFSPDGGISFKKTFNEHTAHPMKHEPVGTNLFDATQADAMVRYLIDGLPDASPSPVARGEWPKEWLDALNQFARNGDEAHDPQDGTEILDALASVGALRPPSPPAVVGKPTKGALADFVRPWVDERPTNATTRRYAFADALLAAPIWPTAEPAAPTSMGASDAEIFDSALTRSSKVMAEPPADRLRKATDAFMAALNPEAVIKNTNIDACMKAVVAALEAEPPATVDAEVEAIANRHNNTDSNFPDVREIDYNSPNAMLQRAHKDRRILLAKLRQRAGSGVTRDDISCNPSPQMDHLGAAQFAAGLLERSAQEQDALVDGDGGFADSYRRAARHLRGYYVPAQAITGKG